MFRLYLDLDIKVKLFIAIFSLSIRFRVASTVQCCIIFNFHCVFCSNKQILVLQFDVELLDSVWVVEMTKQFPCGYFESSGSI